MPVPAAGVYRIDADTKRAEKSNKSLANSLKSLISPGGAAATAIAGVAAAAGAAFIANTKTAASLARMSQELGSSTEDLSAFGYAAERMGVPLDEFRDSVVTLSERVLNLSKGEGVLADRTNELGLTYADLNGKLPLEQMELVGEAITRVIDPSRQAALANEIFGDAGVKLLPILRDNGAALDALRQEAVEMGKVVGTDTAEDALRLSDNVSTLKGALEGAVQGGFELIIPAVADLSDKFVKDILPVLRDDVIPTVKEISEVVLPPLGTAFRVVGAVFGTQIRTIGDVFATFKALFTGDWAGFWDGLATVARKPLDLVSAVFKAFGGNINDIFVGIAREAQRFVNKIIDGLNIFSFLPGVGRIDRATFADSLRTSGEIARSNRAAVGAAGASFVASETVAGGSRALRAGTEGAAGLLRGVANATVVINMNGVNTSESVERDIMSALERAAASGRTAAGF